MPQGEAALRAVESLEDSWIKMHTAPGDWGKALAYHRSTQDLPYCPPERCFDVAIAGGGLGLVAGAALAARGLRVLVFDRERVGSAHREWNIAERELASLVRWGLFTELELRATVATRYKQGVISFDATGTGVSYCPLQLDGVLDVALDAQSVLDLARGRFTAAGGTIAEGRAFVKLHTARTGEVASVFEVRGPAGTEFYRARLAIDTMGSVSPLAMALNDGVPFDGVCPTAGTVMTGIELDRATGDVLVSVAPAQGERQLIWEGFPGRVSEATVYLFYYDRTGHREAPGQSLLDLFERYFTLLPTYRPLQDDAQHLKPVFGYIPARHGRTGKTAARGLLCLGDSAAGQSPLTFCGFGSFVRHIGRVAMLVDYALRHELLEARHLAAISPHQANLRVAWVFSRFMQTWPEGEATAVNRMMNIFCRALDRVGQETTLRFLQDRYSFREYLRIMLTTARHEPGVLPLTARVLGATGLLKWAGDIAAFAADDALRALYTSLGPRTARRAETIASRIWPGLALRLKAARTYRTALR